MARCGPRTLLVVLKSDNSGKGLPSIQPSHATTDTNQVTKISSGRERFAIALIDAIETMLERGFLHSRGTRRQPNFELMATIAKALIHMIDVRGWNTQEIPYASTDPSLFLLNLPGLGRDS